MRSLIFFLCLQWSSVSFSQRTETIYRTKGDSLQNYYQVLIPDKETKGLLVVLGGFCTTPEEVLRETKLPRVACKEGYTVVIPFLFNECDSIDIRNTYQARLEIMVPEVIKKYNIPTNRFIIGGQSLGGHRALFYAEQAYKKNDNSIVKPTLVFGVDPPLNLKRLWYSFEHGVKINFSEISVAEGKEQMKRFKILYGGSPLQYPKKYEEASSFYPDAKDGGNAKYLKTVPVRLYCDPDVNWIIENRRGSFEYMNATDLSGCISQLRLLGNKNAEFVNCLGKGFKPDGTRHPHYFSMLDADEFISWANRMLGNTGR